MAQRNVVFFSTCQNHLITMRTLNWPFYEMQISSEPRQRKMFHSSRVVTNRHPFPFPPPFTFPSLHWPDLNDFRMRVAILVYAICYMLLKPSKRLHFQFQLQSNVSHMRSHQWCLMSYRESFNYVVRRVH